jgi:uncharacterized protein with von Willebrand factor type A (vWA) domain
MDALSDYLTEDGDVSRALQTLMQRGMQGSEPNMQGLRDILEQLRKLKQGVLDKYDLNSLMHDIREKLEELLQQERRAVDAQLDPEHQEAADPQDADGDRGDAAQQRRDFLNQLPKSLPQALQALRQYPFLDQQAAQAFQELLQEVQQRSLSTQTKAMQARGQPMAPEEIESLENMARELNAQLRQKLQARSPVDQPPRQPQPEQPSEPTLDPQLQSLQQQAQQWQSLLESLSEAVRRELEQLVDSNLEEALKAQMAEIRQILEQLSQKKPTPQRHRFKGKEPVSLEQALELMEKLQQLDQAEKQLENMRWSGNPQQVDSEKLRDLLGEEAYESVESMREMARQLEEAGYIAKTKNGMELTPMSMRKIGQKALRDIFAFIRRDQLGEHETRERGGASVPLEENKPYEFGDPMLLDLAATVFNAIARGGLGTPVSLHVDDFEVRRQEYLSQTSTVILIDMSGSMAWNNCFFAAKKVAMALDNLIRNQFPRDTLQIVGFYTAAEEMKPADLPFVKPKSFGYNSSLYGDYYDMLMGYIDVQLDYRDVVRGRTNVPQGFTNMQQGLRVAEQLLSKRQSPKKQIIMITDGQPTAHCEGDRLYLQYPPSQRTLTETLREVKRCTTKGIAINTFMLAKSYYLERFVDQITQINRGRAFYTTPEQLGEYLVVDYLTKKRRRIA